jgi:hypothetical protein
VASSPATCNRASEADCVAEQNRTCHVFNRRNPINAGQADFERYYATIRQFDFHAGREAEHLPGKSL